MTWGHVVLAADGVDMQSLRQMKDALESNGAAAKIVAPRLGTLKGADGAEILIDFSLLTSSSVLFDAVYVPRGAASVAALAAERDAIEFVTEAYRHCKPIAATTEGVDLLRACPGVLDGAGVFAAEDPASPALIHQFIDAIGAHRFWDRVRKNRTKDSEDETRGRQESGRVSVDWIFTTEPQRGRAATMFSRRSLCGLCVSVVNRSLSLGGKRETFTTETQRPQRLRRENVAPREETRLL